MVSSGRKVRNELRSAPSAVAVQTLQIMPAFDVYMTRPSGVKARPLIPSKVDRLTRVGRPGPLRGRVQTLDVRVPEMETRLRPSFVREMIRWSLRSLITGVARPSG